jgi:hypothetical protein
MATTRKKLTTREQIAQEKLKIWDLYCKSRVQETIENTKEDTYKDIYNTYMYSFNLWGGVEFVFWLQALAKKCKSYNSEIEPIAIFSLPKRNVDDKKKIINLQVIAKQMGLDVTITNNRKPKLPVVRKPKQIT